MFGFWLQSASSFCDFFSKLNFSFAYIKVVITAKNNMVMMVKHELQSAYTIIPICTKKAKNCVLAVLTLKRPGVSPNTITYVDR